MSTGPFSEIPLIDLGPYFSGSHADRQRVAGEVHSACERIGFFLISGHGVDPALCEQARDASRDVLRPAAGGEARHQAAAGRQGQPGLRAARHRAPLGDDWRGDAAGPEGIALLRSARRAGRPLLPHRGGGSPLRPQHLAGASGGVQTGDRGLYRSAGPAGAAPAQDRGAGLRSSRGPFRPKARERIQHSARVELSAAADGAGGGAAPRRRAFGLRQSHHLPDRGQAGWPAGAQPRRHLGGRAGCRRIVRGQYRRPDDALDERPLALHAAPRGQPAAHGRAGASRSAISSSPVTTR